MRSGELWGLRCFEIAVIKLRGKVILGKRSLNRSRDRVLENVLKVVVENLIDEVINSLFMMERLLHLYLGSYLPKTLRVDGYC